MIKTSVIVPIYNVEKYLPKCLDSLINQTLKDIEIICINDESPDGCDKILEAYANKDSRIIVVNQKNSGQGSARNRGLEIAKGKYIQFLDSDDFYEPNCCEEMYNLMEKHPDIDVACFDTNIIYDAYEYRKDFDSFYFQMRYQGKHTIKQAMMSMVDCNCWNKIFRKSFIDKNALRFPEKLHYEDYAFFWFWMTRVKYIYFYPKKLTNYLRRAGSFLGEIFEKSSQTIFDDFKVFELIKNDLVQQKKFSKYKETYIKRYLNNFRWLINCFPVSNYGDKQKLCDICSDFLSQFDISDVMLEEWENSYISNIIKKNYYMFGAYKKVDEDILKPIYKKSVNIVFSTDLNYVSYLSVAIQSIISNSSLENDYDIIILQNNMFDYQKRFLLSMVHNKPNISIRFFDMNEYIRKYQLDKLFIVNHITISAYFRLFVGKIFAAYKKILYLDCDLVLTRDIAQLFSMDIEEYPIAAVKDTVISNFLNVSGFNNQRWQSFNKYMFETLGFSNSKEYFNSGVMIIDIDKFNEIDFDYLIDLAKRNNEFFHDQNVLNVAFENNYYQLPAIWNFQWNVKFHSINECYKSMLPNDVLALYEDYDIMPAIIHYTSHEKPWKNPYHSFANIWWQYARKSPFYEIILKDFLACKTTSISVDSYVCKSQFRQIFTYRKDKLRYLRYKILSKITFGKMREHYKRKKRELKMRLKEVKKMLNSK